VPRCSPWLEHKFPRAFLLSGSSPALKTSCLPSVRFLGSKPP
jgi:hypothetical protein